MAIFTLAEIIAVAQAALGAELVHGTAGGTIVLWAQIGADIVLLGRDGGPWMPDSDGNVRVDTFVIELTRGRERFLDGTDPDGRREAPPTLEALATALTQALTDLA